MKPVERFYEYANYKQLKITPFQEKIGVSQGYFSTQLKRNGNIGSDVLNKIVQHCEDLSLYWLVTGKGGMFRTVEEQREISSTHSINENSGLLSLVEIVKMQAKSLAEKDKQINTLLEKIRSQPKELKSKEEQV